MRVLRRLCVSGLTALALAGCTATVGTPGPFRDALRAQSDLVRGRSTRADVERILGPPNGTGSALLPTQAGPPSEVWFYQDAEIRQGITSGRTINRLQFVLVFFQGESFDGLMWWPIEQEGKFGPSGSQ
jgi:hypothetical protein